MAYTRHEWECGEVVTAELLNNMEEGIDEAVGEGNSLTLGKGTADEVTLTATQLKALIAMLNA